MDDKKDTSPRKTDKKERGQITFDDPPPANMNHTLQWDVHGTAKVNDPNCRIMGVSRDHFVTPAFAHDPTTFKFTVTIPANVLWDDVLYILIVYSASEAEYNSIFLDTRPKGT